MNGVLMLYQQTIWANLFIYFYKKFAFSKLTQIMDRKSFILESLDIMRAIEELKKESNYGVGHGKINPTIMVWIGYITRYWSYVYEISTKQIYKYVKFDELCELYEAYHSLDIEETINRINEAHDIKYLGAPEYKKEILKRIIK